MAQRSRDELKAGTTEYHIWRLRRMKQPDVAKALRDQVILGNMGLVYDMLQKFRNRWAGVDRDDVVQCARIALINAVDKFDPLRGYKFSTYACRAIINEISRCGRRERQHESSSPPDQAVDMPTDCADQDIASMMDGAGLTDREREVIDWRFGLGDGCDRTYNEIGELAGVSAERVRQIARKALERIRVEYGDSK